MIEKVRTGIMIVVTGNHHVVVSQLLPCRLATVVDGSQPKVQSQMGQNQAVPYGKQLAGNQRI